MLLVFELEKIRKNLDAAKKNLEESFNLFFDCHEYVQLHEKLYNLIDFKIDIFFLAKENKENIDSINKNYELLDEEIKKISKTGFQLDEFWKLIGKVYNDFHACHSEIAKYGKLYENIEKKFEDNNPITNNKKENNSPKKDEKKFSMFNAKPREKDNKKNNNQKKSEDEDGKCTYKNCYITKEDHIISQHPLTISGNDIRYLYCDNCEKSGKHTMCQEKKYQVRCDSCNTSIIFMDKNDNTKAFGNCRKCKKEYVITVKNIYKLYCNCCNSLFIPKNKKTS
jgi:hypothetical protein